MSSSESSKEIDTAAADWAAKLDRAPLSAEEQDTLQVWLAGDMRRLGAFAKARAVLIRTERAAALGPAYDPAQFAASKHFGPANTLQRRRFLWLGAAATAVVAAAGVGLFFMLGRYRTNRGEMRLVVLDDGSAVTLNTASEIAVAFTDARRTVQLLAGEALFEVTKNAARPFIVEAGDTRVRAVGTSFSVRRLAHEPVEVMVQEGVVEVTQAAAPSVVPVRVAANSRATVTTGRTADITAVALAPAEAARAYAWREGMIAFEAVTLREAAKEFARYSDKRVRIDDDSIANETITGLYSAHDPAGFAKAVASALSLHVDVTGDEIRLHR